MKLLLDTHALLWNMSNSPRLRRDAQEAIPNLKNEGFVSTASIWEAATKYHSGRLPEAAPLVNNPKRVFGTEVDAAASAIGTCTVRRLNCKSPQGSF